MERSDYKPLTDEELDWVNHWQARKIFRERIMEQLRRANTLAAILQKYHFSSTFTERASEALDEALAAYLGETND